MPLDKSRIQGFGHDGGKSAEKESWFGQESKEWKCPKGHVLTPWCAKPGWCDGCGSKINTGDPVMDCRQCNYYLCRTCAPEEAESSSLWGSIPSFADMGAHPAVSSALDNVALSIGDVLDAATQDLSEMAGDLKSFVASAVGLEEEPEEEQKTEAKKVLEAVSPRSRQEAMGAISDFCQKYPAARVRPTTQELEKLWAAIGGLKPVALNSAFYDELSFSNGDTSWQPRLRVLFALEFLFRKDGPGKEVAISVFHQARSLILHLTEVQQCAEKAKEVIRLFSQKKEAPREAPGEEAKDAKAKASPTKGPPPGPEADLLDMSAPVATVPSPAAAPGAAPGAAPADLDLLGELQCPAPPSAVATLAPPAAASASTGGTGASGALSPSAALALALSSAPMAPTATLPQDLDLLAAPKAPAPVPARPASGLPFAGLGMTSAPNAAPAAAPPTGGMGHAMGPMGPMGLPAASLGNAAKAAPRVPPPFASRGKVGHPYMPIPASLDSPSQPPPLDQFAFVSDITGIGDLAKPAK